MAKASSKRFFLVHVYGGVDPSIIGEPHKTHDSLLKAAKKFVASEDYTEDADGLFYLVCQDNRRPEISNFTRAELEND